MGFMVRKRAELALALICVLFLLAKLIAFSRYHFPLWDEAVYLGMGKFIFSEGASGLWEPLRPIGLSLIVGGLWLLKLPLVQSAELVSIAFAAGYLALTYLLAVKATGKNGTGLLALALVACSPVFIRYSSLILSDIPSAFFALLAVYILISADKYALAGLFAGFSFLIKFPSGLLIVPVVSFLALSYIRTREARFIRGILGFAFFFVLILSPYLAVNYLFYSSTAESPLAAALLPLSRALPHQGNPAVSVIKAGDLLSSLYNILFYCIAAVRQNLLFVAALAGLAVVLGNRDSDNGVGKLVFGIFIAFCAYFTIILNKQERFLLLFLPYVAILAALGLKAIWAAAEHIKPWRIILGLIVALSFAWSISLCFVAFQERGAAEPEVVHGLYSYFSDNGVGGIILTSDPVFAAYSDNLFIPYYFSVGEGLGIVREQDASGNYAAIAFSPANFYCPATDETCSVQKEELALLVAKGKEQVLHTSSFGGEEYSIYLANQTRT